MKMFKYIKNKKGFVLGFIFKIFEVGTELMLPIFMAILISEGINGNNLNKGLWMVGFIMVCSLLGYLSTFYAHYLAAKVSQGYARDLREALFSKMQSLSIESLSDYAPSSLTNRINIDVMHMQNGLAMTMRIASRAPVLMVGSIVALFIVSPGISLVLVIGLPILLVILGLIMRQSMRQFKSFQKRNDKAVEVVKDNVEGSRMIRAFAQVDEEALRYEKENNALSHIMIRLGKLTSLSSPLTMLLMNLMLLLMIYIGVFDISAGTMTQEQLIQVINYTTQLTLAIIAVMNLALLYTKSSSAAIRIWEILNKETTIVDKGHEILELKPAKIEFEHVGFTYKGHSKESLKHINLLINPGEVIGVVGLTGSGKTTFVDLLLRFYDTTEGTLKINGINIKDYQLNDLRSKIAYASQKASLLTGNIEENLQMGTTYAAADMDRALKNAKSEFALELEKGVLAPVYKQGMNYSGGQRQRLALSRAFLKPAAVLILDDVFSALDYLTDKRIRTNLKKMMNKSTVIIISQRLSSLVDADKIIVLNNETIEDMGTHQKLLVTNKLYRDLYETQIGGKSL